MVEACVAADQGIMPQFPPEQPLCRSGLWLNKEVKGILKMYNNID